MTATTQPTPADQPADPPSEPPTDPPTDDAVLHAARAASFNSAAAQYAANRPSYPPALFDAVEELAGRSLSGARTVDVGAGTGIASALLHARGADVLAVEPGAGMAAEFRRTLPHIPLVRGSGDALPVTDSHADLLTYAQAWHWTDPARSVPEALRVLRPGGALALWWNTDAPDVEWIARAAARAARFLGVDVAAEKRKAGDRIERADPSGRLDFARRTVRWSRRVPIDTHLANIGSHSAFLLTPEDRRTAFLEAERAHLLDVFPDAVVEETYDVLLLVARKP
ncbi:class I SAM-dependent methyltransferase [Streptomyces sp. NPDC015171]|uniref:class I SAM-dependent methyltransferase n=1 Tax=Streptomyces sp. NPDC015171 TaxID=3364945 RepID=UPI0036FC0BF7